MVNTCLCSWCTLGIVLFTVVWGCGGETSRGEGVARSSVPIPLSGEEVPSEGVLLRVRLNAGDELVYAYRRQETLTEYAPRGEKAGQAKVIAEATLVYRCLGTNGDKFEIEQEFESPKFDILCEGSFKGREETLREAYASAWRAPRYFTWSTRYGVNDNQPIFPEERVCEGDEWVVEMPAKRGGGVPVTGGVYRYRVEGFERVGQFKAVKVRVEAPSTPLRRSVGPAFVWYDLERGVVVRVRMSVEINLPSHQVYEEEQDLVEVRRVKRAGQ